METLCAWADQAPAERYPQLCRALPLFPQERGEEADTLSPLFLAVMAKAPDKARFLAAGHRLTLLLGNHDVDLSLPGVRRHLETCLDAQGRPGLQDEPRRMRQAVRMPRAGRPALIAAG